MSALALAVLLAATGDLPASASRQAQPAFACPAATELRGAAPPDGFEVWCERPEALPERRREGPSRSYYDDGGLAKSAGFREGRLHGAFLEWHRNGKLARSGDYREGEREGTFRIWYEDGTPEEECGYQRGERHGSFAAWWPSGRRRVLGRFCHGLQCGVWTTWDESGRELGKTRYEEIRGAP